MRCVIMFVVLVCLISSSHPAESSQAEAERRADTVPTRPESCLHQAEKALRSALSGLTEEVTFEYAEHSPSLTVKYRCRKFMVHGGSKPGAFSEKPHEVEGPDLRGFLLRVHVQDEGTVNQAVVPQTIRQPYWRTDLDITVVPGTGHQLYWALAYGSRTDESLLNGVRAAVKGLGTPVEVKLPPPGPTTRKSDHLDLTLGWIADSDKPGEREYLFVLNGIVAYRTVEGLRNHVKGLPKGSTIRWAPGCCRMGDEPLLSSPEEMRRFRSLCESCGVTLEIIPSG